MQEWEPGYRAADIISPWTVGRFDSIPGVQQYVETCVKQDIEWCARHGIEFMPVVFPGFGWSNLQKGISKDAEATIDRQDGRFLWAQYAALFKAGTTMIYQARAFLSEL